MKRLLTVFAVLEAATGLALMIDPAVVARLLLGADVLGAGAAVGRVAGIALVALGLACWPGGDVAGRPTPAMRAMLTYNVLVMCYLVFLAIDSQFSGVLLWPAVAIHGLLTVLLIYECFTSQKSQDTKG